METTRIYLQKEDLLKIDKKGNILSRDDGGVYPMQWLLLVLVTAVIAFVLFTIILGTLWAVLAEVSTFGYAINAANAAQNYTTSFLS